MVVRPYLRAGRDDASPAADRVLAAAEDLIHTGEFHAATVTELAARAGVARATVFTRFGSKLGVLEALSTRCADGPEMLAIRAAVALPEPRQAVPAVVAASCRLWERQGHIMITAKAVVELEPAASGLVAGQRTDQRESLAGLVARLDAAGDLRPGLTAPEAVATLHMLTSLEAFLELRRHGGIELERVVELLSGLAQAVLAPG